MYQIMVVNQTSTYIIIITASKQAVQILLGVEPLKTAPDSSNAAQCAVIGRAY